MADRASSGASGASGTMDAAEKARLDEDMAAFFGKKDTGPVKQVVVRGANLWEKKQVTISGERIAKVDRVASQVAKLIVELREASVPVHNSLCLSEYLEYLRNLCDLADVYISSKMIGVGLKFRVNKDDETYVGDIEQGTPAAHSEIKVGDVLWQINGKDVYKWDFQDMAELYLGRVGTEVELILKRASQPHPVIAKLRRQEGEYMHMHLPIPLSELRCKEHPWAILERIRFAETTLLQLRFELEEWGAKAPFSRLCELVWHDSVFEDETARFHHRLTRLAIDLGLDTRIYADLTVEYIGGHKIRDPFAQLVWRGYFHKRPCAKMREFLAAVQNELRNFGLPLLTSNQCQLVAKLMGISLDDCISCYDVQSFVDRWLPPCRFPDVDAFPWKAAGNGFVDAALLAEVNLIPEHERKSGGSLVFPDYFFPFLGYQESCFLLLTADPGTFVMRYSKTPGNFAIQWTSNGRQIKHAKVFAKEGGYSWRHDGKLIYPNLGDMIHEVHAFLSQGIVLPPQRASAQARPLGPEDD